MRRYFNWRTLALSTIGIIAMVLLLSEPTNESLDAWLGTFFGSKCIGILLLVAIHRHAKHLNFN